MAIESRAELNTEEYSIARMMLKNKILSSDGAAYEKLFTDIMSYYDKDFQPVKPHGRNGDKKNDGFNKVKGIYYQVYAPEDIDNSQAEAIAKAEEDFEGLYKYWQSIACINEYFFVINDKYKGAYPITAEKLAEIELKLLQIKSKHQLTATGTFLAKDLEDIFFQLSNDQMVSIIGFLPDSTKIESISFTALDEVIKFLIDDQIDLTQPPIPVDPSFDKKIEFNNLSDHLANLLRTACYQLHSLKQYFNNQPKSLIEQLQKKFNGYYLDAMKFYQSEESGNDLAFAYILDNASPQKNKSIQDAVLVLMSYFFEKCDIFEEPK